MDLFSNLISSFNPTTPKYRPTEIYSECWLIKLVLHQAAIVKDQDFLLGFQEGSTWFSEGLLPTAFRARFRGDPLSESRTNADGVIGQINPVAFELFRSTESLTSRSFLYGLYVV